MKDRWDIAQEMVLACHRLYARSLVTAMDGNVSARIGRGNILITPRAINKGSVAESDLVEVKEDGSAVTLGTAPSSELPMHLFVYRHRGDVGAIVHAHPPYATGFAAARVEIPESFLPEVLVGVGPIPLAPYATPSTQEMGQVLLPYVARSNAILLSNHGAVTFGATVEEAYYRMEKVEQAALILFVARVLGGEKHLTASEQQRLLTVAAAHAPVQAPSTDISEQTLKQLIREVIEEKLRRTNA